MADRKKITIRLFRGALSAYLAVLTLSMYRYTYDPTGEIKWLLLGWSGFLLGGGWLVFQRLFGLPSRRPGTLSWLVFVFTSLMFLTALLSDFRVFSLLEAGRFVSLAGLFFVASQTLTKPVHVRRFLQTLCWVAGLTALYAAMQRTGIDPFPWGESFEGLPSTYGNPNYAAHVLILAIIAAGYLLAGGWWAALPLGAAAVLYFLGTEQRGGMVALAGAAALPVLAWTVRLGVRKPARAVVLTLVLAGVLACAAGVGVMGVMKAKTGSVLPLDSSILLRYQSLVSASRMVLDHPLKGHGPGVYKLANPRYWTPYEQEFFATELRYNHHVHNDPLELAVGGGLPMAGLYGLLLLFALGHALVLALGSENRGHRRLGLTLAAMFTAFFLDGLFGFNLRLPVSASLLFILLGALEGVCPQRPPSVPVLAGRRIPGAGLPRWAGVAALLAAALGASSVFAGEYYLYMGVAAQASQNRSTATGLYRMGLSVAPWNWEFHWRLGQVAMLNGDMAGAVREFERTLELNPHHLMVRVPLAEAQMQLAQAADTSTPEGLRAAIMALEQATRHAGDALEISPETAEASDALGRAASIAAKLLVEQNRESLKPKADEYWSLAREYLRRAAGNNRSKTNRAALYRNLARVCISMGDLNGAGEALVRAARLAPEDTDTWPLFLGFAQNTNRYDLLRGALSTRIDLLRLSPKPDRDTLATANLFLANVLENGWNDLRGTENAYWAAVQYAPLRPEVWTNLARYTFASGRFDVLRDYIRRSCAQLAAKTPPVTPLPQVAAVNAVFLRGQEALENATLVLATAARSATPAENGLSPTQTFGWAATLLFDRLQQRPADAPDVCGASFNLALVFASLRQDGQADALFSRAKECLPEETQPALALQWADLRVRQDRLPEAMTLLKEARIRYPENIEVRWALARALVKQGQLREAAVEYESLGDEAEMDPQSRELLDMEGKALKDILDRNPPAPATE
ncbi:MAG: tetratricopeptide repeat protein [Candidatus Hydrogenedentes bacterium]|nr:tetratricopeptide repeat protein [Candidatus Hydrogenedentota bacterium]